MRRAAAAAICDIHHSRLAERPLVWRRSHELPHPGGRKREGKKIMTAPDPAAKEKAHAPTTPVPAEKGDELTTQELEGVVGGTVRDPATGLPSGKRS